MQTAQHSDVLKRETFTWNPGVAAVRLLNLDALDAVPLARDPYDHIVVPGFLAQDALDRVNRDYPAIGRPGNVDLRGLAYGPAFQALLDELESPVFAASVGRKFSLDLAGMPTTVTVRKYCEASDGSIHTDHWSKVITVLVYFNAGWSDGGGRLRLLRSRSDMEDYACEVEPRGGTLLAFRRTDQSYHGHKRFEGERRMLQLNWVTPGRLGRYAQKLDRLSTRMIKRFTRIRA